MRREPNDRPALAFIFDNANEVEGQTRARVLQALALVYFGRSNPVTIALTEAIADPNATDRALNLLDAAPALRRRRLLAAYAALLPNRGARP